MTARLPWLWEYKRKKRKIPKKEREKEKKEGYSDLLVHFLFVKISENHHKNILIVIPLSIICLTVKDKTTLIFQHSEPSRNSEG